MKKSSNQESELAGKLWMISMGLFLIALGSLFVWYLWAFFQKSSRMDHWVETPCLIDKSEVDDSGLNQHYGTKFALIIAYRYQFDGQDYSGDKYQRIQPSSSDPDKINDLQKTLPPGTSTICFVNPENPATAVLKKDTKGAIFSIWFPGLFILGGFGMVISAFRRKSAS